MGCTTSNWSEVKDEQLKKRLTARQIQLVKDTWELLAEDMEETGMIVFTRYVMIITLTIL